MNTGHVDLPLDRSAGSRFMVWIMTGLVYASVLLLGLAALADGGLRLYDMRAKLVPVTIPSPQNGLQAERNMPAVLDVLQRDAGVAAADPVSREELEELVEPWFDDLRAGNELPLPRLIDMILHPAAGFDLPALQERLREAVPGVTIGSEAMVRDGARRLATLVRIWAGIGGLMVLLGALIAAVARLTTLLALARLP